MAEKANTEMPIEKKKWYKNIMAIIGMAAALIGIIAGIIQIKQAIIFKEEEIPTNVEIVLDRSASMRELLGKSFDERTKWDAAVLAVEKSLQKITDKKNNLALRVFGGACLGDSDNTERVVEFGQDNEDKVRNALRNIKLIGETTLVSAITEAIGDLEQFKGLNKTLIVITGSSDSCNHNDIQFVHERMQDIMNIKERIKMYVAIIGMGLKPSEKTQIVEIAEMTGGRVFFPDNLEELKSAIESKEPDDTTPPAPPRGVFTKTKFRLESRELSKDTVKSMLQSLDFYCKEYYWNKEFNNPNGVGFDNNFEEQIKNGDKVILDRASGLMWQQSGSDTNKYMIYKKAKAYITKLNRDQFAGYNDWRLPTLEEAMSLMEPKEKGDGLYIDTVFDKEQQWIWTSDQWGVSSAWVVSFSNGSCNYYDFSNCYYGVRAVR